MIRRPDLRSTRRRHRFLHRGDYAELHCLSDFSFQRGASDADELFARAKKLGYRALAITDECSLSGIVRALQAAEREDFKLIVGSEFRLDDGLKLVLLCIDRPGYSALSRIITLARRAAPKGHYKLTRAMLAPLAHEGLLALWIPASRESWDDELDWVHACFPQRTWIAVERHRCPAREPDPAALAALSHRHRVPRVACGDVHMHVRSRRALQDAMTAIRLRKPVHQCGDALFPNGEHHLRHWRALQDLHSPEELAETLRIAQRCHFSLRQLTYEYPEELVPSGLGPTQHLRALTEAGAMRRWPDGVSAAHRALIEKELTIIAKKDYEAFFLTVHDIVRWARSQDILCQGRGSAANSIVCYCLEITAVGPERIGMLFERFVSEERNEAPDIDVDFEHERREEVMQYIYNKYGRERAALAATVISYRDRSAARDLGRALGFGEDQIEQLAGVFAWGQHDVDVGVRLRERGFDPDTPEIRRFCILLDQLVGAPRHLSQHVGGFVISGQPLWDLVPVENATMKDRTVIQWDKDDLEALGLLKVDCLALGMLTCVQKCFGLVERHHGRALTLATVPEGDEKTYDMICAADTIGVFQIESRAQMAMLPRMKPRQYYDLVIEVAIVRPGPIEGEMVHPYLRRRQGLESFDYPNPDVEAVLWRTLGVPLFQEQVMKLLEVAADFTPGEADQLRRSMAAWKRNGGLEHFRPRILEGMRKNNYTEEYANRIIQQIKGFGSYGFPESHAASFALLAYVSSYLKCHYPAAFACALINSYPMGFYTPGQIVADLRRHRIEVRAVDVLASEWDCTLESRGDEMALRLGLRMIAGLREEDVRRVVAARESRVFDSVADLAHRARLEPRARALLASAGALKRLSGHRHRAFWEITALDTADSILAPARTTEERPPLRPPNSLENVTADYARLGLTLETHPLSFIRRLLRQRRCKRSDELAMLSNGATTRFAGLVTLRQRPAKAGGVTFLTLEDERGLVNVVVWQRIAEQQRRELLESRLLGVDGVIQHQDGVRHLSAQRLLAYSELLPELRLDSRDFR